MPHTLAGTCTAARLHALLYHRRAAKGERACSTLVLRAGASLSLDTRATHVSAAAAPATPAPAALAVRSYRSLSKYQAHYTVAAPYEHMAAGFRDICALATAQEQHCNRS